jgi:hypothetical protein
MRVPRMGGLLVPFDDGLLCRRAGPQPSGRAGRGHRITVITGDVYSVDEARDRLDHTGWRFTGHRPLAGPQSLVVAQAASATGSRSGF